MAKADANPKSESEITRLRVLYTE